MKIKNIAFKFTFLITLVGLMYYLNSCYPDYGMSTQDYDMVITRNDTNVNFGSYKYFYMPDSIYHISIEGIVDEISRAYDKQTLALISNQFEALGYTRVFKKDDVPAADTGKVFVVLNAVSSVDIEYYYSYWGYYGYGWYYPYYPYYPGYYPPYYGGTYTYTVGTLITNMMIPKETVGDTLRFQPVWTSIINGLTTGSSSTEIKSRINTTVIQAFAQSPYLGYYGDTK